MKKRVGMAALAFTSVLFLAVGCMPQAMNHNRSGAGAGIQSAQPPQNQPPQHDAAVIPSIDSAKQRTTNQHGTTYSGMGSSVLSRMGSSGLHAGGISMKLESILSSAGMDGVKVFVIDDTVILGDGGKGTTKSSQYDELQSKLLSNTSGTSGTGRKRAQSMAGTMGTKGIPMNNREQARKEIERFTGGNVRILVVEHQAGLQAIDRLRANMQKKGVPIQKVVDDVKILLNHAK
ncbi:MAG: hypothetical protein ACM32O_00880 [Clostridia bacterium]